MPTKKIGPDGKVLSCEVVGFVHAWEIAGSVVLPGVAAGLPALRTFRVQRCLTCNQSRLFLEEHEGFVLARSSGE